MLRIYLQIALALGLVSFGLITFLNRPVNRWEKFTTDSVLSRMLRVCVHGSPGEIIWTDCAVHNKQRLLSASNLVMTSESFIVRDVHTSGQRDYSGL